MSKKILSPAEIAAELQTLQQWADGLCVMPATESTAKALATVEAAITRTHALAAKPEA
jgi:hypothetical protein